MSSSQIRSELERKRKQRLDAEQKSAAARTKDASKRSDATKAREAAGRSKSPTTVKSKLRDAERRETEANTAGKEAAKWQSKASGLLKAEMAIQARLTKAEQSEAAAADRERLRADQQAARQTAAREADLLHRVEETVSSGLRQLREPKPEKLRVLMLGASSEGDLRVGREQARIRRAVEAALHRDLIEIDARPSATTQDLLDGITRFRPHVLHFSGHSDVDLVVFEQDVDPHHSGHVVTAQALASAISATDDPPLLVLLNSCESEAQAEALANGVTAFAIGMSESIDDGDAITYAAQFYSAVANGQSILSAHHSGQAALELNGLESHVFPQLYHAEDVDPSSTQLVVAELQ